MLVSEVVSRAAAGLKVRVRGAGQGRKLGIVLLLVLAYFAAPVAGGGRRPASVVRRKRRLLLLLLLLLLLGRRQKRRGLFRPGRRRRLLLLAVSIAELDATVVPCPLPSSVGRVLLPVLPALALRRAADAAAALVVAPSPHVPVGGQRRRHCHRGDAQPRPSSRDSPRRRRRRGRPHGGGGHAAHLAQRQHLLLPQGFLLHEQRRFPIYFSFSLN